MRIASIAVIVLVCALAVSALLMQQRVASADGHQCPSSLPSQSSEGLHTDDRGKGWFLIRSSDSNGYTHVRAYVADDSYGPGYIPASPDETCYLIVRRPGDAADAAQPTQVTFRQEREPENLPLVEDLFASLSASEISCIRNIIGRNQTLQTQRLMDNHNTLPVYNCIDSGKMYEDATIAFLVRLFALQDGERLKRLGIPDGERSYNAVNCLIGVSTQNRINRELVHLRLGTVSMNSFPEAKQFALGAASNEMTRCMPLHEQILNLLNIVVKQNELDSFSDGDYIISAIDASTNSALQDCISSNVGSRLNEISGKKVIQSFKHFPNGELLNCLLLDQQTAAKVYAHVASSRAGISSPTKRLSANAEACFEALATSGTESTYRLLVTLAVDPQGVVEHSSTITADDAVLNSLVGQGLACMMAQSTDLLTAFNSSNLALRPPPP